AATRAALGRHEGAAALCVRGRLVRLHRGLRDRVHALVGRRDRVAPALGLGPAGLVAEVAPVSWVAHDVEPDVFQRKLGTGVAISFVALVLGSWGPDLVTKWFAYGVGLAGFELKAADPTRYQRGWPGVGFTHSLTFGVAVAVLVYLLTRSKPWAIGLLI